MNDVCYERVIFVHLPKTGGTSARHAIENLFHPEDILRVFDGSDFVQVREFVQGRSSWFVSGHMYACILDVLADKTCSIFISRDPIARFFSAYNYWRTFVPSFEVPKINAEVVSMAKSMDFQSFLHQISEPQFSTVSPLGEMVRVLGRENESDIGSTLEGAVRRLNQFDVVLTTENLNKTLPMLLKSLGLPVVGALPYLNKTDAYKVHHEEIYSISSELRPDMFLHSVAAELENKWASKNVNAYGALRHNVRWSQMSEFSIFANGPVLGTGVLPIESKMQDGKQWTWRRIEATPMMIAFDVDQQVSGRIELRLVTSILESGADAINIKINDFDAVVEISRRCVAVNFRKLRPLMINTLEVTVKQGPNGEMRTIGWDQICFIRA